MAPSASTKKKSSKKKQTDPERAARRRRIAIGAATILGAIGFVVGGLAGVGALDRRAAGEILPGDPEVSIAWPAGADGAVWLPTSEQRRLDAIARDAVNGGRALRASTLEEASRALHATGWFHGFPEARWDADGTIHVEGRWRVPAAAVLEDGREILIDWDGRVLPISYREGRSNQFVIQNAALPSPGVGALWDEPEIMDALRLRELLATARSARPGRGGRSGHGARPRRAPSAHQRRRAHHLGRRPRTRAHRRDAHRVKLERLRELQRTTGRIDASVRIVDIRGQHILMQRHER